MKSKYQFLCDELKALLKKETEIKFQFLVRLKEIEDTRLYLDHGFGSLDAFCIGELKLSGSQTHTRVNAMRGTSSLCPTFSNHEKLIN
jgi:hypothetical protein